MTRLPGNYKGGGLLPITNTNIFKYLLISIHSSKCMFTPTVDDMSNKATKGLYALRSKISFEKLPIKAMLKVFSHHKCTEGINTWMLHTEKTSTLQYKDLATQDYLLHLFPDQARTMFKWRSRTLDLKSHLSYKYNDLLCRGCKEADEWSYRKWMWGDKKRSSPNGEALKLFLQEHTVKGGDSEHLLVCRKE